MEGLFGGGVVEGYDEAVFGVGGGHGSSLAFLGKRNDKQKSEYPLGSSLIGNVGRFNLGAHSRWAPFQ